MSTVKKIPQRQCVGCQQMKSKKEMIRVLHTAENEFILDPTGKKSGRGAYICPDAECLNKAIKNKASPTTLNQMSVSEDGRTLTFTIPKEVYENLQKELAEIENR